MGQPVRREDVGQPLREPYEELRAIHPSLPELDDVLRDERGLLGMVHHLMEALENAQRRLIQRDTQLAGLRDLTDHLLTSPDIRDTAQQFVHYLWKGYGFPGVSLVLDEGDAGVHVYWSGAEGPAHRQGDHVWSRREVRGTELGQLLWGEPTLGPWSLHVVDSSGDGAPHPNSFREPEYDLLIPLQSRHRGRSANIGVLAVRRSPDGLRNSTTQMELEGIAHSVTSCVEHQRLRVEVQKAQRLQEDLLRNLGHALIAVDLRERILAFNHTAAEWIGVRAEAVVGQPLESLPRAMEAVSTRLRGVLDQKMDLPSREGEIAGASGKARPVSVTANLLRDDRGQPYGAVAAAADLSVVKAMEQRIRQLDRLAAVGQFTGAIAHEIKNPLAGIAAGVEFLRSAFKEDAPEQKDIKFLLDEIHRLNRIIGELLDLAHPREPMLETVQLLDILEKSAASVRHEFQRRSVALDLEVSQANCSVAADPDRLRQVFINLFKNAVEVSESGQAVRVSVFRETPGEVVVVVEDRGAGINDEQKSRLFEPFFTTKKRGMGLGLYVSHGIIQRHGGRMEVESQPGRGSRFRVVLPMKDPWRGSGS